MRPGSIAMSGGVPVTEDISAGVAHQNQQPHTRPPVRGASSLDMVERAIAVLEDDEHLNAGYGSNLTLDGTVECDAAIMGARDASFGSVGAVSGVRNPIRLARSILEHARVPDKLGRVPPLTLTSSGAYKFAASRGIDVVPPETLKTAGAEAQWGKWKARLAEQEAGVGLGDIQDTVGAVAYNSEEGMAAGVSSGGLLLKWPGRVGEAAIFGAGCWANRIMACSVSGTGEDIIREHIARKISEMYNEEADPHKVLDTVLRDFWGTGV
ncbi:Threonine aspartase 1 [Psilocybe cubensis]|uniref:Threonine aspartase 1 n=2 Tax=Psilocybe cubensis TaxID=181762 RepID=A0ACB8HD63_PSICU|nr:Threonine aspartase 1 [Psilocybe cubensis]KAH9485134.1 Threonine aspartase 1 [Psilocybe cubensis]